LISYLNSVARTAFVSDVLPGSEFRLGPSRPSITVPKDLRGLALAHDGKRMLALLPAGAPPAPKITVVLDGPPVR
jgi:hypothetical protein